MNKKLVSTSKFLSLVLRHRPETIDMQLDDQGWMDINALIEKANAHGNPITLELLHEVVATNDKQRFALSEDGLRVRASQGHSVASVDLQLTPVSPPELLFHGTVPQFLPSIRKTTSARETTCIFRPNG
jgi:putative RNA 2'-phosphotransferase